MQEELVDISLIEIRTDQRKEKRLEKFVEEIRNPYHFKVGKVEVELTFSADGMDLQKTMEKYFENMS